MIFTASRQINLTEAVINQLNLYGDERNVTIGGHGVDIAAQRCDDLDTEAIEFLIHIGSLNIDSHSRALDAASASGGQAVRMACAGAEVIALDIDDYSRELRALAAERGVEDRCRFVQADLTASEFVADLGQFEVIVCQRMIHYLRYAAGVDLVKRLKAMLKPGGRLYISASGLDSELGEGYPAAILPIDQRYADLSVEMVTKHGINGPVCLYREEDMAGLLEAANMHVERVYASAFGNIKAIAW